ncbi:M23 family metallopeptidase [Nucisporomicrobium flavum]|uniref:M23 family metallopeptidase n=1 Tax=Nucisporomicrobium flavum TaxID=2785915 RepID=UPI003C2D9636
MSNDVAALEDQPAVQHRAPRHTTGRHRRTAPLHSHRAPREPIADKGRYAVAAALVAGVSVAGVSAAGDSASPAGAVAKSAAQNSATQNSAAQSSATTPLAAPAPTTSAGANGSAIAGASTGSAAASTGAGAAAAGPGAASAGPDAAAPGSGAAAGVPAGPSAAGISATAGDKTAGDVLSFIPQLRKAKPLPQWVNPMPEGAVTSCFGQRWGRLHAGVDLAAPSGTPIHAAGAGIVVSAGVEQGYGNAVLIDHGNGYLTHYGHMSAITATLGQRVRPGDEIGKEGSTGHSTGPHLHFEVHEGSYKNPIEPTAWMRGHGVDIPGCASS